MSISACVKVLGGGAEHEGYQPAHFGRRFASRYYMAFFSSGSIPGHVVSLVLRK